MHVINYSPVSKPFVMTAVIISFIGSSIGTLWMLSFFGVSIPAEVMSTFKLHRIFQLDGFVTLIIMGIGYMIIPRMRNEPLQFPKLAQISYFLVLFSILFDFSTQTFFPNSDYTKITLAARLTGVGIFATMMFLRMKTVPKLLKETDYFITISFSLLIACNVISAFEINRHSLAYTQLWLLFPILMIFGIEYKTLPSFLAFIRPKRKLAMISIVLCVTSGAIGLAAVITSLPELGVFFNLFALGSAVCFAVSVFIYGGFDNSEVLRLISGEKKSRYLLTILHTRVAFGFLFAGLTLGLLYNLNLQYFAVFDLAIHFIAIGFIGITIMLYLPLMLPPITGKSIRFLDFNTIPLILIVSGLSVRVIGDMLISAAPFNQFGVIFGISGFIVLAGMFSFVIMIHKSMKEIGSEASL